MRIPPKSQVGSLNRSAVFKMVILITILIVAIILNFPAARVAYLWTEDLELHMTNNTTWLGMSSQQKMAWVFIPGFYIIGLIVYYGTAYRTHRKRLFINGLEEGTVMYIHGFNDVNSNIYDWACILFNKFRHMPWEHVPRPLSRDYYENEFGEDWMVLYYKLDSFVAPWRWKRMVIENPDDLAVGAYSAFLTGQYIKAVAHPYNRLLNYSILISKKPYSTVKPDYEKFENYHEEIVDRVQRTNISLLQGNPSIMGPSVKNNIMIQTGDRISEELELMDDEEKKRLLGELNEPTNG